MRESLKHLVHQMQSGDMSFFDSFYRQTYKQVFYMIYGILHDRSLSEDIMQDTYMKMIDTLPTFKSNNPLAYLLTIAKNTAINEYNKRKKTMVHDEFFDSYVSITDQNIEVTTERREIIEKALLLLSPLEKDVFLLHTIENMKHREIALLLDKPIGTITWIYQSSVQKISQWMKEEMK